MENAVSLRTERDAAGWPWQSTGTAAQRSANRMPGFGPQQGALTRLRPAKINFYIKVLRQQGFSAEQVLSGTGISPADLADPLHLVEISKYIRIIANITRLSGSSSLAFTLGEQLTLGDLGILGYSVMTCSESDEATWIWHQYNPVFFGNLIEMGFENVGDHVLLSYLPYADIRGELLQFLVEEKICCDMALQRLIGIEKFPVERLALSYPEPDHIDRYRELIDCPIEFSAPRSTMLLTVNALSIPLQGRDEETHQHCLRLLTDMFNSVNAGSMLSHRVKALLHQNLHRHLSISDVAERLHCTARTLNRRLEKEAVNFSDLNVATRLEAIENLLATTNLESGQIASRVGFAEVRSLRRFFKTHTGKTMHQFKLETMLDGPASSPTAGRGKEGAVSEVTMASP
jgi:AraC-like DNA-binding protein